MKNKPLIFIFVLLLIFAAHCFLNIRIAKNHTDFFLHDDGTEYLHNAISFAETGSVMAGPRRYYEAPRTHDIPEIYRPPLLAYLTGTLIVLIRDPLIAGAIVQALIAVLLFLAVFRTAQNLSKSRPAGLIAALLVTFHPLIFTFSIRYSSELGFLLFLTLFLLSWLEVREPWKFPAMGLAAGLACGMRPTALLFLPAVAVFLLCKRLFKEGQDSLSHSLRNYLFYALAFCIAVLPWSIRNYINFGIPSPSGCFGGYNFYLGNNRDNAKAYRASDGKTFLHIQNQGWHRANAIADAFPENLPPAEQDKRFRKATFDEIKAMGIGEFLHMILMKAWHFIRPWPLHGAHPASVFRIIALFESALFIVGGIGLYLFRKRPSLLLFMLMIFSIGFTAHTLIISVMRHRIPFLDLLLIFSASACVRFFQKNKNSDTGEVL